MMDLKSLIVLAFVLGHALSINSTSPDETYYCPVNILEKVFTATSMRERIAQCLTNKDLKNMAIIRVMANAATPELNNRFKVLHYQDSKITPSLSKAWERILKANFTSGEHRSSFSKCNWTPYQAIQFGSENPLNITCLKQFCFVLIIIPHEDHLTIFDRVAPGKNGPFVPNKREGSQTNGVIFPWLFSTSLNFGLRCLTIEDIDDNDAISEYQLVKSANDPLKLTIVISNVCQLIQVKLENQIIRTAQTIRKYLGNMPICIIAQSDIRSNVEKSAEYDNNSMFFFYGRDTKASTLVVDTRDEETMRKKLLKWKEELCFLDSHQTIAFHFTMINGNEPENSEQIFSDIFPNIQLSTLRLLGGPSIIGVDYQVKTGSRFDAGPVYAIIGFPKFGYGYSDQEYFLSDSEYSYDSEYSSDENDP